MIHDVIYGLLYFCAFLLLAVSVSVCFAFLVMVVRGLYRALRDDWRKHPTPRQ